MIRLRKPGSNPSGTQAFSLTTSCRHCLVGPTTTTTTHLGLSLIIKNPTTNPTPTRTMPPEASSKKKQASKFSTDCRVEHQASLTCISENYGNQEQACQSYYQNYKKCRQAEHERRLEENKKKLSFW